jgi:hypothetical protein
MRSLVTSGSGIRCLFDPGIRNRFFPDPVSQTHTFESLVKNFWVKTSLKIGPNFFLQHSKSKIIKNFVEFMATKKV